MVRDYNTGIYTLPRDLKGLVIKETNDYYYVLFQNVVAWSSVGDIKEWVPK